MPKNKEFSVFPKILTFFLDLVLNKSSYYKLCACTNPISKKILVFELLVKSTEPIGLQDSSFRFWQADKDARNVKDSL